jgi:anti-sigma-K factor RskA
MTPSTTNAALPTCCDFHGPCDQGRNCPIKHQQSERCQFGNGAPAPHTVTKQPLWSPLTEAQLAHLEKMMQAEKHRTDQEDKTLLWTAILLATSAAITVGIVTVWAYHGPDIAHWLATTPLLAILRQG